MNEAARRLMVKLNVCAASALVVPPPPPVPPSASQPPLGQSPLPGNLNQIPQDLIAQIVEQVSNRILAATPAPTLAAASVPSSVHATSAVSIPVAAAVQPPARPAQVDNHAVLSDLSNSTVHQTRSTENNAHDHLTVSPASTCSESREVKSFMFPQQRSLTSGLIDVVANFNDRQSKPPSRSQRLRGRGSYSESKPPKPDESNSQKPSSSKNPASPSKSNYASKTSISNQTGSKTLPAILAEAVAGLDTEDGSPSAVVGKTPVDTRNSSYKARAPSRNQETKKSNGHSYLPRDKTHNHVTKYDEESPASPSHKKTAYQVAVKDVQPPSSQDKTSLAETKITTLYIKSQTHPTKTVSSMIAPLPSDLIEAWNHIDGLLEDLGALEASTDSGKPTIFTWLMGKKGFTIKENTIVSSGCFKCILALMFRECHIMSVIGESRTNEIHAESVAVTNMIRHLCAPVLYDNRCLNGPTIS